MIPTNIVVQPVAELPHRVFVITTDPYGATIQDRESGLAVILDWNGSELKAIVSAEGHSHPTCIHVLKPTQKEQ